MGIVNSILPIIVSRGGSSGGSTPPPGPTTYYAQLIEGTASDNGLYEGFVFGGQYLDGSLIKIHKSAGSHVAEGVIPFQRSTDMGLTWSRNNISVASIGEITDCAALTFMIDGARLWVAWQDSTAAWIKIAYRNGLAGNFTLHATINAPSGYTMNISPVPMKETSEGKIRLGVYYWGADKKIGFIEKDSVWARLTPFYTGTGVSEFDWAITDDTGDDTTCKVIAVVREYLPDDGGTYYYLLKSTDGCTTATYDSTSDVGSFVDDNGTTQGGPFDRGRLYSFLPSNSPVSMLVHNGEVIIANGERAGNGKYRLKFIKASLADAFENKFSNWTRPITIRGYNAEFIGSSIDCGYSILFHYKETASGSLKVGFFDYDVSPYTANLGITTRRCHIYLGSLEDWLYFPAGTPRTDIITGSSFFSGYTSDFNADHSYDGDTEYIQLAAGTYTNIQFRGKAQGVKIVGPESGVAEITEYIAFGDWTEDCVLMSHPNNPLREESLVFNDSPLNYFTIYSRTTGSVLVKGVKVAAGRIGMQIETRLSEYANLAAFPVPGALDHNYRALNTGIEYHWEDSPTNDYVVNTFLIAQQVQNVKILNSVIDGTDMEGIYNGADQGSPIPTNTTVRNVHTLTTGRDGVQLRNGYMKMIDVQIDNAGDDGNSIHGHGAPIGANSTGALLQRVKVDAAFANSLFSNALGTITCEVCYFQGAGENGGYINNYTSTTENILNQTSITYNLVNCHFEGVNKALWMQRDPAKLPMTVNRTSTNTYTGAVTIETGNGIVDNVLT